MKKAYSPSVAESYKNDSPVLPYRTFNRLTHVTSWTQWRMLCLKFGRNVVGSSGEDVYSWSKNALFLLVTHVRYLLNCNVIF